MFIDQGHFFNAGEWDFPDSPLRGAYVQNSVYAGVTSWQSFEPILSDIEQIDVEELWKIVAEIPAEWYEHNSTTLTRLTESLHVRRTRIRELIASFRNSSRSPFPNWKGE